MAVTEKVIEAEVKVRVRRTKTFSYKDENGKIHREESEDKNEEQVIAVHQFVTEPARARVNYGIGPSACYQGVNLNVTVEYPCYREQTEEGIAEAKRLVVQTVKVERPLAYAVLQKLIDEKYRIEAEMVKKHGYK
jgi:hypothetical protein